jgi:hypothetical protein
MSNNTWIVPPFVPVLTGIVDYGNWPFLWLVDSPDEGGVGGNLCGGNGRYFDDVWLNPGPVVTSILTVWYKSHRAGDGEDDVLMQKLKSARRRTN